MIINIKSFPITLIQLVKYENIIYIYNIIKKYIDILYQLKLLFIYMCL